MSKPLTTVALALVSMAYGYIVAMQSWDVVSEFAVGYVDYALEYMFTVLLAGVGLWALAQKAGRRVGDRHAAMVSMMAALIGFMMAAGFSA